jgi:hypothetical protein
MPTEQLQVALEAALRTLTSSIPVDVMAVCRNCGVTVTRNHDVPARKARLVRVGAFAEIKLPLSNLRGATPNEHSSLERFQIGHELAHYIIARDCGITPLGRSEYWRHERICDSFSGRLLLPTEVVSARLRQVGADPGGRLGALAGLANIAVVPWYIAAQRFFDVAPSVTFFGLRRMREKDAYKVTTTTNGKERGRLLKSDTEQFTLIEQLPFDDTKRLPPQFLSWLPSVSTAIGGAIRRGRFDDVRIAARLPEDVGDPLFSARHNGP